MKRSAYLCMAVIAGVLTGTNLATAQSQNQPLGDYARAAKKAKAETSVKSQPTVYDNDNLPKDTAISVVGASAATGDKGADEQKTDEQKNADAAPKDAQSEKKSDPEIKPGQSADERQKAVDAWKDKIGAQQDQINLLSREMDVLKGEAQVKAAQLYADPANRIQNASAFANAQEDYQKKIDAKQKDLDDAKSKLSDLQDQARRAGAPSSAIESGSAKDEPGKSAQSQ